MERVTRFWKAATVLVLAAATLTGCVKQREYDDLYSTNRTLEERNVALQQEIDAAENTVDMLRARLNEADANLTAMRSENAELRGDVNSLQGEYGNLVDRLNTVSLAVLDPATDKALRDLAAQNPGLIQYDSNRGVLRFASDLTFGSGSDQVSSAGADALKRLASVLSGVAVNYDLRIVGHTDNVRISRPATLAEHKTNLHLSAHRAISVFNVLRGSGIPPARMEVAGRGEYQPIVSNQPGGTAQNRRVEIFLVPMSDNPASTTTAVPDTNDEPAANSSTQNPMK